MEALYPSLHDKFRNEGICPICMMAMGHSPKYSCTNGHTVCHRCKPYYYACPTCRSPLDLQIPPVEVEGCHVPPPMHYMPHPYPSPYPHGHEASAPFIDEAKYSWAPPTPSENQELKHCGFCHAGCEARFPEHLRAIHESRCQFRPNLEDDQLPTDLSYDEETLLDCRYRFAGCNVRLPEWRKRVHEEICIYKDRREALDEIRDSLNDFSFDDDRRSCDGDPEELVECMFRRYGCMVRMPRRRRSVHQQKCNYRKHRNEEDYEEARVSEPEVEDPDQPVPCPWADYGCQVMPRHCRKDTHAEKCNYRMQHCSYKDYGCDAMFQPARRFAHERSCEYAS